MNENGSTPRSMGSRVRYEFSFKHRLFSFDEVPQ